MGKALNIIGYNMKLSKREIMLAMGALGLNTACGQDPAHVLYGTYLPHSIWQTIDGKTIDIANLKKPLILHFFGLWCNGCISDMANWHEALRKLNKISEISVISVHSGSVPESFGSLKKYYDELDPSLKTPLIDDANEAIAKSMQIPGFPSTLHIDSGGRVVEHSWALGSPRGVKSFLMKTDKIFGLDKK